MTTQASAVPAAGLNLLAGDTSVLEESTADATVPATTLNAEMGAPVVDSTLEARVQDCPILDVPEPKSQDYPILDVLPEPKLQDHPVLDVFPEPRLNLDCVASEAAHVHTLDEAAHRYTTLHLALPAWLMSFLTR